MSQARWSCPSCEFENAGSRDTCVQCREARPGAGPGSPTLKPKGKLQASASMMGFESKASPRESSNGAGAAEKQVDVLLLGHERGVFAVHSALAAMWQDVEELVEAQQLTAQLNELLAVTGLPDAILVLIKDMAAWPWARHNATVTTTKLTLPLQKLPAPAKGKHEPTTYIPHVRVLQVRESGERRKWLHQLDHVHAILYAVSLKDFCVEDDEEHTGVGAAVVSSFSSLVHNKALVERPVGLLFCDHDAFAASVALAGSPFRARYADYTGGSDASAAEKYVHKLFVDACQPAAPVRGSITFGSDTAAVPPFVHDLLIPLFAPLLAFPKQKK